MLLSWGRLFVLSVNIEKREISNGKMVNCPGHYVGHSDIDFLQNGIHFDGVAALCP
jgi:hypothetical protein